MSDNFISSILSKPRFPLGIFRVNKNNKKHPTVPITGCTFFNSLSKGMTTSIAIPRKVNTPNRMRLSGVNKNVTRACFETINVTK